MPFSFVLRVNTLPQIKVAKRAKKSSEKGVKRFALQGICMPHDNIKYKNDFNKQKYDAVTMQIPKGFKQLWQNEAKQRNMSLTAFVIEAVKNYIEITEGNDNV